MYIASDYPYTYSDLEKITAIFNKPYNTDRIRTTTLCKTLAGNPCPLYIITNFSSTKEEIAKRNAIILTARVHPGEVNGSFVIEGVVKYLIGNTSEAYRLRESYVIKVLFIKVEPLNRLFQC
jgi:hypothetical protein